MAADVLDLRLDGLDIPIDLAELEAWSRAPHRPLTGEDDLAVWFSLLERGSRSDLVDLLRAPLLRDQSFGRQLLDTWTGGQMLAAVGDLLTAPDGTSTTPLLQSTLLELLDRRQEVSAIELLRALPLPRVSLRIDGLMRLAEQWRHQLRTQRRAAARLEELDLPVRRSRPLAFTDRPVAVRPIGRTLAVPHRREPLPLLIWSASNPTSEGHHPALGAAAAGAGRGCRPAGLAGGGVGQPGLECGGASAPRQRCRRPEGGPRWPPSPSRSRNPRHSSGGCGGDPLGPGAGRDPRAGRWAWC